jgi:hypothetical protein
MSASITLKIQFNDKTMEEIKKYLIIKKLLLIDFQQLHFLVIPDSYFVSLLNQKTKLYLSIQMQK